MKEGRGGEGRERGWKKEEGVEEGRGVKEGRGGGGRERRWRGRAPRVLWCPGG